MGSAELFQTFIPSGTQVATSQKRVVVAGQSADMTQVSWSSPDGNSNFEGVSITFGGTTSGEVAGVTIEDEGAYDESEDTQSTQTLRLLADNKQAAAIILIALLLSGAIDADNGKTTASTNSGQTPTGPMAIPTYLPGAGSSDSSTTPGSYTGTTSPFTPVPGSTLPSYTTPVSTSANDTEIQAATQGLTEAQSGAQAADLALATGLQILQDMSLDAYTALSEASAAASRKNPDAFAQAKSRAQTKITAAKAKLADVQNLLVNARNANDKVKSAQQRLALARQEGGQSSFISIQVPGYGNTSTIIGGIEDNLTTSQEKLDQLKFETVATPSAGAPASQPEASEPVQSKATEVVHDTPVDEHADKPVTSPASVKPQGTEIVPGTPVDENTGKSATIPPVAGTPSGSASADGSAIQTTLRGGLLNIDFVRFLRTQGYQDSLSDDQKQAVITKAVTEWNRQKAAQGTIATASPQKLEVMVKDLVKEIGKFGTIDSYIKQRG